MHQVDLSLKELTKVEGAATLGVKITDGKIVEDWESYDALGFIQQLTPPPTDTEANKAIINRVFEGIWNQKNLPAVDDIFAAEWKMNSAKSIGCVLIGG